MRIQRFLITGFIICSIVSTRADTIFEQCKRLCGSDEECFQRCVGDAVRGRHPKAPDKETPTKGRPAHRYRPSSALPPSILETGYDFLYGKGTESTDYGLYSYIILPSSFARDRAIAFLYDVFRSVPPAGDLQTESIRINMLYIPTKKDSKNKFSIPKNASREAVRRFLASHYDFSMARLLLDHLCDQPAEEVEKPCRGALSDGPYILTYGRKISDLTPLPPPILFVDLTNIHKHAFGQFVRAYEEQVKRPDFSDRDRIDTFRLRLLDIVLKTADWVKPVSEGLAGVIYQVEPKNEPGRERRE